MRTTVAALMHSSCGTSVEVPRMVLRSECNPQCNPKCDTVCCLAKQLSAISPVKNAISPNSSPADTSLRFLHVQRRS